MQSKPEPAQTCLEAICTTHRAIVLQRQLRLHARANPYGIWTQHSIQALLVKLPTIYRKDCPICGTQGLPSVEWLSELPALAAERPLLRRAFEP